MAASTRRKNQRLLELLRAAALAGATYVGLAGMSFSPGWGAIAFAVGAGLLGYVAVDLGVLVALIALAIPMTAANPVVGLTFIVLGVVGIRYLGADGGRVFMIVALAVTGASVGPAWAAAAIAGLVMSAGEGALAAAIACLTVEAIGISLGKAAIGVTTTGGSKPLLVFSNAPDSLFSAAWLSKSFSGIGTESVDRVVAAVATAQHPAALIAQPLVWAAAAGLTAVLVRESRKRDKVWLTAAAVGAGALIPAVASVLVASAAATRIVWGDLVVAALTSMAVAVAFAFIWETVFPLEKPVEAAAAPARADSMAAEDADVDELLRLISTAEETLASKHTTERVVMITDMKSFSRMTEEDGSILTAKAIQRHRDLLLPLVEQHGGHGKSTGGDGLVAAFESPAEAMIAAAQMQQALDTHNSTHPNERDMTVRIGIADGEVVLDKGGRPFIGAALNLAARVMNLADGGQAFATAVISAKSGGAVKTHSHGTFELKNIAKPIEVVEILWGQDQRPSDPRSRIDETSG